MRCVLDFIIGVLVAVVAALVLITASFGGRIVALEQRAPVLLTPGTPVVMHWHYSDGLDMCEPELTTLGLFVQRSASDPKVRLAELKSALEVDIQTQDLLWHFAHGATDRKTW